MTPEYSNNNLEPCPFCGGKSEILHGESMRSYVIECKKCELTTPDFSAIEAALNYWNNRIDGHGPTQENTK